MKKWKRFLAMLLVAAFVVSDLPSAAFVTYAEAETVEEAEAVEEVEAEPETVEEAEPETVEEPETETVEEVEAEPETVEEAEPETVEEAETESVEDPETEAVEEAETETVEEPETETVEEVEAEPVEEPETETVEEPEADPVEETEAEFEQETAEAPEEVELEEMQAAPLMLQRAPVEEEEGIYWLPADTIEGGINEEYEGNDDNSGTSYKTPVKTFGKAVELVAEAAQKTIYAMNSWNIEGEVALPLSDSFSLKHCDNGDVSNKNAFFSTDENISFSLSASEGEAVVIGDDLEKSIFQMAAGSRIALSGNITNCGTVNIQGYTGNGTLDLSGLSEDAYTNSRMRFSFDYAEAEAEDCYKVQLASVGAYADIPEGFALTDDEKDNGWALLLEEKILWAEKRPTAIYLSDANGDDSNSGYTSSRPVKTFEKAKEILGKYRDTVTEIRICDTIPAKGTWDLTGFRVKVINAGLNGNIPLIKAQGLTLTNITVENASGAGIRVESGLTVGSGVTISSKTSYGVDVQSGVFELDGSSAVSGSPAGIYLNSKNSPIVLSTGVSENAAFTVALNKGSFNADELPSVVTSKGNTDVQADRYLKNFSCTNLEAGERLAADSGNHVIRLEKEPVTAVYIGGENASDDNPGTHEAPVATVNRALEVLYQSMEAKYIETAVVHVIGEVTVEKDETWDIENVVCRSGETRNFLDLGVNSVTFLRQQREGTIPVYTGNLFTQKSGTSLTIREGIVLDGNNGKTGLTSQCGYVLDTAGRLEFYGEVRNNYAKENHVIVESGGTLNFYGAICDNAYGKSLSVKEGGTVNIAEGKISGNQRGIDNSGTLVIGSDSLDPKDERIQITNTRNANGITNHGTLTLNYGILSSNSALNGNSRVIYNSGKFIMNGGVIANNSAAGIYNGNILEITGGTIRENGHGYTGELNGGAIYNAAAGVATVKNLITEGNKILGTGSSIYNAGNMLLGDGVELRETTGVGQPADADQEYAVVSGKAAALKLAGSVQIAGKIWLKDFESPIQIVESLTGDAAKQTFLLHLDQGWSSKKVADLAEQIEQEKYKERFELDAFTQEALRETGLSYGSGKEAGDLWLLQNYYVYLGDFDETGDQYNPSDENDGTSVEEAVRTFERAKAILEEKIEGKSDEEAKKYQILLCGKVEINDEYITSASLTGGVTDWNFEEDTRCNTTLIRMASYTGDSLVTVGTGKTLKLGNVVIDGRRDNYWNGGCIITVSQDASLEMAEPAELKNAKRAAVSISRKGKFVMSGGTISKGGTYGVYMNGSSEFTMTGGTIQESDTGVAIYGDDIQLTLENPDGMIRRNSYGINITSYSSYRDKLVIHKGFQIVDNSSHGVSFGASDATSTVQIDGAFISGNKNGVALSNAVWKISGSTIKDFSGSGVSVSGNRGGTISNTTITGSTEGTLQGIGISGSVSSLTLSGSEISNCLTGISYSNNTCIIEDSKIHDNSTGISLSSFYTKESAICRMRSGELYSNSTAVSISSRMTFELYEDAGIHQNTRGVYVNGGTFRMNGGSIYNNTRDSNRGDGSAGVYVNSGTFRMTGGKITKNKIKNEYNYNVAAGLYVAQNGSAQLAGGVISENELTGYGIRDSAGAGGICIDGGTVTLQGTKVTGNTEQYRSNVSAAGVCITNNGTLHMTGGEVSENVSKSNPGSNKQVCVGGIYVGSGTINLSGGSIYGNQDSYQDSEENAKKLGTGIYSAVDRAVNFNGANAKVSDLIRLGKGCAVTIEKALRTTTGTYILDVPTDSDYGTVVVTPKSENAPSASSLLSHFTSNDNKFVLMKSGRDIILGTMIFVDGVRGSDSNTGNAPDQSLLTVEAAIAKLQDYVGIIYIVDTVTVSGSADWQLSKSGSYISRYTGFDVGATDYSSYANKKDLFRIAGGGKLTIDGSIAVDGGSDSVNGGFTANGSLFYVEEGGTLTVNGSTLRSNHTSGNGGAVRNEGTAVLTDDTSILDVEAENGSAVYQNGILTISGNETVSGDIYLCGSGESESETSRVVQVGNAGFRNLDESGNAVPLQITIQDPYDERDVVAYPEGTENLETYLGKYRLESEILDQYRFLAGTEDVHPDCLYLKEKGIVYVNGTDEWKQTAKAGKAAWGENYGHYPATAFVTMKEAYEELRKEGGGLIYIVGEVSVGQKMLLGGSQYEDEESAGSPITIDGTVSILRYARPTAHLEDTEGNYVTKTYTGNLFKVTASGSLTMQELSVSGHGRSRSGSANTAAGAVTAEKSLIRVEAAGQVLLDRAELKDNIIGNDADGGAVSNAGTVTVKGGSITNVSAGGHGDSIYQDGSLRLEKDGEGRFPEIEGAVYLCGNKAEASSRYIEVEGATLSDGQLTLEIEDPYNHRKVIAYEEAVSDSTEEPAKYELDEYTRGMYTLRKRDADAKVLELYQAAMVYIDGVNGSDSMDGTTPKYAVKTLEAAYRRLKSNGGTLLYVVDTVTVSQNVTLTSTGMEAGTASVELSYPVTIRRYSRPDAAASLTGYEKTSNVNALFCVDGEMLELENLVIDGHKAAVTKEETTDTRLIAHGVTAQAPLIEVKDGTLYAGNKAALRNNVNSENTGGAVCVGSEDGTGTGEFLVTGGSIAGNEAKGTSGTTAADSSGVFLYPSGILRFAAESGNSLEWGEDQYIYLDAEETLTNQPTGNFDSRVAHITVDAALPSGLTLPVDMDREHGLAAGRKVVEMRSAALTQPADYLLADGITGEGEDDLKLQKRRNAEKILELQKKETVQINVTVPLYVCMYAYGGNGHVVTPAEDAYRILNHSDCAVQIASVQATECIWNLKESADALKAGELFLELNDQVVTGTAADTSADRNWRVEAASSDGGEAVPAALPVPIRAAIAGGSVNEDGEAKVCTVTYTVKAAED